MKTRRLLLIVLLTGFGLGIFCDKPRAQQVSVNFSLFYNELGHYGHWVNSPRYGQVWIYAEPGFRPYYSGGHWDYTDYGWSWASDYTWGWAPFHYGRWEEDPYYGWIWIPGYEWAPAWVSWSEYNGYYGWAPLGFGVSFNIGFGAVPYNRWVFVPRQHICEYNVYNYYVHPRNSYFHNAVVINNYNYNGGYRYGAGPRRYDVERYIQHPIQSRSPQWGRYDEGARNENHGWANRGHEENRRDNRNYSGNDTRGKDNPGWNNHGNGRGQETKPNWNNNGHGNQRPQDNNSRDWDNRPGSRDHRISQQSFPQQNYPSSNPGRGRNDFPGGPSQGRGYDQKSNFPQHDFPGRNNPVMGNEGKQGGRNGKQEGHESHGRWNRKG